MLCLVARYDSQVIRWRLPAERARLGSATDNELVVPFPGVSRHHAMIAVDAGRLHLSDLKSKNGIIIEGRRVVQAVLEQGQIATIGRATLTLEHAPTADIEMALATPGEQRFRASHETSDDASGQSGARAALRLIRDIESRGSKFSGRRRDQVLSQAREVLFATTLALCSVDRNQDISIGAIVGPLPDGTALERARAIFGSSERRWKNTRVTADEGLLILAGRGSRFIMARFSRHPEPWADDLIALLAERFIGPSSASGESPEANRPNDRLDALAIPPGMVIGTSSAMTGLQRQIAATVSSGLDVLLLGETGTGKELFARMIHNSGPTKRGPFLGINCAAIPAELLEAELFGVHGRVATGVDPRPGLFAKADGGSILLDEIGELPERLQAKLLRVLQEREILPIGALVPRKIRVRIISASNRDLAALVQENRFRADLYYRLRGLQFKIPPLRERKDDVPALVVEFITRAASEYKKEIAGVSRRTLGLLVNYDWPGNIRELENEIRRAVLVCPRGGIIQSDHLGAEFGLAHPHPAEHGGDEQEAEPLPTPVGTQDRHAAPLRDRLSELEREEVERALAAAGGNKTRAARALGITRNGLALKMKRLGLASFKPRL